MAGILQAPWPIQLGVVVLFAALLASVVSDLRSRLILNAVTLPALALILALFAYAGGWGFFKSSLIGVAVCAGPMLLASIPGWIGMGDAKLMAVVGAAVGWPDALAVLFFVTVAGGAQAILQLAVARVLGRERPRYVPYACAIAAGTVGALLFGDRLF